MTGRQVVKWFFSAEMYMRLGWGSQSVVLRSHYQHAARLLHYFQEITFLSIAVTTAAAAALALGLWVLKRTNYNVWRHYVYPLLLWLTLCDLSTYMYMYVHFTLHQDWLNGYSMNSFLYCVQFSKLKQFVGLSSLVCRKKKHQPLS